MHAVSKNNVYVTSTNHCRPCSLNINFIGSIYMIILIQYDVLTKKKFLYDFKNVQHLLSESGILWDCIMEVVDIWRYA